MSSYDELFTLLLLAVIIVVGLGLGADSTMEDFKSAFKMPKAVLCGFACQYGFMPLCAFAFVNLANIPEYAAIGVILTGASPGGTTSNLFTHWSHGDVPLSITMSFCSTLAAMFMLPLLVLLYIEALSEANVKIPWGNIIISTLVIALPTALGLWVRRSNTTWKFREKFLWEWLKASASGFGAFFVVAALVSGFILHWNKIITASWELWVFAFIMEPLGCFFGYCMSRLLVLPPRAHPTIALECGVQNFPFAMIVISLSFGADSKEGKEAFVFPVLYGLAYVVNSAWIVLLLRKHREATLTDEEKKENADQAAGTGVTMTNTPTNTAV
jgi:BASS family bile acid:Na+ symporter